MRPLSQHAQFLTQLRELTRTENQRSHTREPKSISLRIQPLDLDFRPDGEPFWAVSRDLSEQGLGFINGEPLDHEYVRIGIFEDQLSIIGRVCHSTSIGVNYPLYLVGVELLEEYCE